MTFEIIKVLKEPALTLLRVGTIRTPTAMTSFTITAAYQDASTVASPKALSEKKQDGAQSRAKTAHADDTTNDTKQHKPEILTGAMAVSPPTTPSTTRSATRKRKALTNTNYNDETARDPRGLALLSFPMRLRLLLERCGSEGSKTPSTPTTPPSRCTTSHKRQKKSDECEDDGEHNTQDKDKIIIGWLSGGNAFKIYDEERFVREIMPTYFHGQRKSSRRPSTGRRTKKLQEPISFEAFKRDLDLWGFTDMPSVEGPPIRMSHVCSHPNFVRDDSNAWRTMRFKVSPEWMPARADE